MGRLCGDGKSGCLAPDSKEFRRPSHRQVPLANSSNRKRRRVSSPITYAVTFPSKRKYETKQKISSPFPQTNATAVERRNDGAGLKSEPKQRNESKTVSVYFFILFALLELGCHRKLPESTFEFGYRAMTPGVADRDMARARRLFGMSRSDRSRRDRPSAAAALSTRVRGPCSLVGHRTRATRCRGRRARSPHQREAGNPCCFPPVAPVGPDPSTGPAWRIPPAPAGSRPGPTGQGARASGIENSPTATTVIRRASGRRRRSSLVCLCVSSMASHLLSFF